MSHLLLVFLLISLHELTPNIDGYQWNAHGHFEQTILKDLPSNGSRKALSHHILLWCTVQYEFEIISAMFLIFRRYAEPDSETPCIKLMIVSKLSD